MGTVSRTALTEGQTNVTHTDLNNLSAPLLTEINGNLSNVNISSSAAIAYSKLNLTGNLLNADVSASAAIAFSKLAALTNTYILVGNASNVATAVAVSGDVTIANTGAVTIANDAVEAAMIADNAIVTANITDANVTLAKLDSTAKEGIIKAWINLDGTGTATNDDSYNVSGIADNGTGDYTITWDTDFGSTNYVIAGASVPSGAGVLSTPHIKTGTTLSAGSCTIVNSGAGGNPEDADPVMIIAIGDQ